MILQKSDKLRRSQMRPGGPDGDAPDSADPSSCAARGSEIAAENRVPRIRIGIQVGKEVSAHRRIPSSPLIACCLCSAYIGHT